MQRRLALPRQLVRGDSWVELPELSLVLSEELSEDLDQAEAEEEVIGCEVLSIGEGGESRHGVTRELTEDPLDRGIEWDARALRDELDDDVVVSRAREEPWLKTLTAEPCDETAGQDEVRVEDDFRSNRFITQRSGIGLDPCDERLCSGLVEAESRGSTTPSTSGIGGPLGPGCCRSSARG